MVEENYNTHDHDELAAEYRRYLAAEYRRYLAAYRANHDTVVVRLIAYLRKRAAANLHIGSAEVAAFLRGHEFTDADGGDFRANNNGLPIILREICRECPDLAGHIELRASRFDSFYNELGAESCSNS